MTDRAGNTASTTELDRIEELLDRYVPMGEEPDRPVTALRSRMERMEEVVEAARGFVRAWARNAKATVRMQHRLALTDALASLDQEEAHA